MSTELEKLQTRIEKLERESDVLKSIVRKIMVKISKWLAEKGDV